MNLRVGDIIKTIEGEFVAELPENTLDKLIIGEASWKVTGIVTTFMATVEVIKRTIDIGANLIITH